MDSSNYDRKNILICGMILVIIILFILNYKKSSELSVLQSKLSGSENYLEKMSNEKLSKENLANQAFQYQNKNRIAVPAVIPDHTPPKDTIRLYYAEWCGHCKRLMPYWDEFAIAYKDKLNIEKIDCENEANRHKCAKVSGFPTIRLFKGDSNKVIEFSKERSTDGLKRFVDENIRG